MREKKTCKEKKREHILYGKHEKTKVKRNMKINKDECACLKLEKVRERMSLERGG